MRASRAEATTLLALGVVLALAYVRLGGNAFLNWDDPNLVIRNRLWDSSHPLRDIWFTLRADQYYPLSTTLLFFQHALWGDRASGYHWVSLLLHGGCVASLYLLLRQLGVGRVARLLAVAFFALHPIQVAAVAWASEQKTLLSGALILAGFERFLRFQTRRRRRDYVLSFVLCGLALLSKTQPVLLLSLFPLAAYLRGVGFRSDSGRPSEAGSRAPVAAFRIGKELREIAPFLVLGCLAVVPTIVREQAPLWEGNWTLLERLAILGRGFWFYWAKILWPAHLAGLYPQWKVDPRSLGTFLGLIAFGLAFLAVIWRSRRNGWITLAMLLFVLPWLPSSGLVPYGHMEKSYVADHLIYLSLAGPAYLFGRAVQATAPLDRGRPWFYRASLPVAVVLLVVCSALTFSRTGEYRDSLRFWTTTLQVAPRSHHAHNNLAVALAEQGQVEPAITHWREALRLKPSYYEARVNLAAASAASGDRDAAIREYQEALRSKPGDVEASARLRALGSADDAASAETELRGLAQAEPPDRASAHLAWARHLIDHGRRDEAIDVLRSALERPVLLPERARLLSELGFVLASERRYEEALSVYRRQAEIDSESASARMNVGVVLRRLGQFDAAVDELRRALALDPGNAQIRVNLEKAERGER